MQELIRRNVPAVAAVLRSVRRRVLWKCDMGENMNQFRAVLFDMDGVLINTEPLHFRMWREVFHNRGVEIDYDGYKDCIGATEEFLRELIWKNYGADFRKDETLKEEAMVIKKRLIAEEGFPKMPGVEEMLKNLYEAGFLLAIASSSSVSFIELAMDYIGVKQYFHVINSGENVAHSKPAPDIYLNTAERLGVKPEECVVLEDSENGSIAAVSAGMVCVGLANPDSGNQNLERAKVVIRGLGEFTPKLIGRLNEI